MKFIPLVCFLFALSFQSLAQHDPTKLLYAQKVEKFRKMKSIGTTLTVTGALLVVAGIYTLIHAPNTTYSSNQNTTNSQVETGALLYLAGVGSLGAGIPLWIIGGINQGRYERKFERVTVGFNIAPQRTGVTLRYRF